MNVLYIIGNGFDKAQGMKTSYPEFYQYLMENTDNGSSLLQQLKKDINADKKLWSDMEEAFGLFTSKIVSAASLENLYFELSDNLQDYLTAEESAFIPTDELKSKFVEDFTHPAKYMGATDIIKYNNFVKNIGAGHDISVMTLNYTNTFEKLLALGRSTDIKIDGNNYLRQVIHIHGQLGDSIIIGVDNESQIANDHLRNNEDVKDLLVKAQSNYTMKFTRQNICENLIINANLIILYGVSLGETDARWWKLIGEQFKKHNNICIVQYVYLPNDISPTRKQLLGRLERTQRYNLMRKLDIKPEEQIEDVTDRLFFLTNSNAFKL